MNPLQGTVGRQIEIVGVGLHSGKLVRIEISPAEPGHGVQFVRTDLPEAVPIKAHPSNVVCTLLCTSLGDSGAVISTVEHLMAAFSGLGVDNALVGVNAAEMPILDGSAAPFVDRLLEAGIQRQPEKRCIIRPSRSFEVRMGDRYMRYEMPTSGQESKLTIDYSVDFDRSEAIGRQSLTIDFSTESFMSICEARTFCHMEDVKTMRAKGLAQGGSLDNAVVVNENGVVNNDGLRYPDEFVRHKILDCIGDLALLGGRLVGRVTAHKAGHAVHAKFAKSLLEESVTPPFFREVGLALG